MGYLNWQSIMQVPNHITGINFQSKKSEEICRGCMLNHQQKKISHTSMSKVTELFQLIHTDFGGPYSSTQKGHKFYISFLDDYFEAIHVYLLKNKNEAFSKFKKYRVTIKLQSDKKIKFICSNNEGKYKNLEFNKTLKKAGI